MMWTSKVVCLLGLLGTALAQPQSRVVQIEEQGLVRGYKDVEGDFYSFLDVPYATSPTGVNKFKAPLPPPVWTETFDAVDRKIICPQKPRNSLEATFTAQEDCLVTNIFVPDTNANNLPVMVDVHGGAYQNGAGSFRPLTSLARTKKVIVVSFNYRLGVHGFLCLGTEDVPGNAGLKDQVALLRWVRRNIANFGGNPDDVTISGCSAGGGSVDLLTISPMATDLFKKAIIGSGVGFGGTGTQVDPVENAKVYAAQLNFTNVNDLNALEEFYKTASYELLLSEAEFIMSTRRSLIPFAPCVERETRSEGFLYEAPIKIITEGTYRKVPLLYGFAEKEGLYRLSVFSEWAIDMNNKFSDFLPSDLQFENEEQEAQVARAIKHFYFGNETVNEETILAYIEYFTDVMFAYPMLMAANLRSNSLGDDIYLYEYSFVDENTPMILNTSMQGPSHCDQANAVRDLDESSISDEYKIMRNTMRELWLNFIITGNPTPEGSSLPSWPPMNGFVSPYMSIKAQSRVEHTSLSGDMVRFWDSIYAKHYIAPVPPGTSRSIPATKR